MMVLGHNVPGWLAVVLGVLAVTGFCAVFVAVADLLGRASAWWHDWRARLPAGDDPAPCGLCGSVDPCEHDEYVPPLAPERTWEQMTSHQLPVAGPWECPRCHSLFEQPGFTHEPCWNEPLSPRDLGLEATKERRAPWWEAEQRQAYEALGFDFPSGLMARVREAAQ